MVFLNKNAGGQEEKRELVFVDIDGTLYDTFKSDDNRSIDIIFRGNVLVKALDRLLWTINSMDVISNSMWILKLRLFIYSFLSFTSYKWAYKAYSACYKLGLKSKIAYILCQTEEFNLLCKQYDVVLVTNNEMSNDILKDFFTNFIYAKNSLDRKKKIKKMCQKRKVFAVIGNNYMDDIKIAKKIGAKLSIYVGSSKLSKRFKASISVNNFGSAILNARFKENIN